jgi:hypothetical protein
VDSVKGSCTAGSLCAVRCSLQSYLQSYLQEPNLISVATVTPGLFRAVFCEACGTGQVVPADAAKVDGLLQLVHAWLLPRARSAIYSLPAGEHNQCSGERLLAGHVLQSQSIPAAKAAVC